MLFLLGTWQLYRLQWKNELISEISKSYDKSPVWFNVNSKLYSKVKVEGKIISQPIFVYNLGNKGQYGYDIYIPVETNELVLLIRAGWVDKQFQLNSKDLNRNISIDAILLSPKRKNYFTPKNSNDLIFFLDMEILKSNFEKNLFP